jgi:hypothetical protein
MSHFYGTIEGSGKTESTRGGSKNSGLITVAASWQGAVSVVLSAEHGPDGMEDYAVVSLIPWHGKGSERLLYRGPVSGNAG